jgi:hypothetical protein
MMKKDIKEKWIKALRSGKYSQATNRLRCGNSFCCLGVLCDVVDPSLWTDYRDDPLYYSFKYKDDLSTLGVPGTLKEDIGLKPTDALTLANLNDIKGFSFLEIADYIEKNIESD